MGKGSKFFCENREGLITVFLTKGKEDGRFLQGMHISHTRQKDAWEKEHREPQAFINLSSGTVSGGVKRFWTYARTKKLIPNRPTGLEIGCGKGRNTVWLAERGATMVGFDFSGTAIKTARARAYKLENAKFFLHDAVRTWPFPPKSFDFVVDCFVSTDLDGTQNRTFIYREAFRVLKPGGLFLLYTNTPRSRLYRAMRETYPADEPYAYYYPNIKKFEKVYTEIELRKLFKRFSDYRIAHIDEILTCF